MHTQQTGIRDLLGVGGNASAGLLAELIAVFPWCWYSSSGENLTFHSDKIGGKDHCRVTAGRIKARNSAEHVFILQHISITNIILSNNSYDINIDCLLLRSIKF